MLPARNKIQHRLASTDKVIAAPRSYDAKQHSVEAVISMGSPVERVYGTEVLRISRDAVDLSRLHDGAGIPLLDHHKQDGINSILGRLADAWFDQGALVGRFTFNQTPEGKKAEGMVARGEIAGISAGYRVDAWEVTDADSDVVDDRDIRFDRDLTFTATRWQLFEASLVGVPADAASMVRSMSRGSADPKFIRDVRVRMAVRQKIIGI